MAATVCPLTCAKELISDYSSKTEATTLFSFHPLLGGGQGLTSCSLLCSALHCSKPVLSGSRSIAAKLAPFFLLFPWHSWRAGRVLLVAPDAHGSNKLARFFESFVDVIMDVWVIVNVDLNWADDSQTTAVSWVGADVALSLSRISDEKQTTLKHQSENIILTRKIDVDKWLSNSNVYLSFTHSWTCFRRVWEKATGVKRACTDTPSYCTRTPPCIARNSSYRLLLEWTFECCRILASDRQDAVVGVVFAFDCTACGHARRLWSLDTVEICQHRTVFLWGRSLGWVIAFLIDVFFCFTSLCLPSGHLLSKLLSWTCGNKAIYMMKFFFIVVVLCHIIGFAFKFSNLISRYAQSSYM